MVFQDYSPLTDFNGMGCFLSNNGLELSQAFSWEISMKEVFQSIRFGFS
jgi:hypothetical protein